MNVTQVAILPTESSRLAGRPALIPELLAATGARYSRNNEGLETILARIDPEHPDKSVDSIFRMIDYGHQSIADMAPVAMFLDGVSIWLAYYIWTLCPTAGGQESSTRYVKISPSNLLSAAELGIPSADLETWSALMGDCFHAFQASLDIWEGLAARDPELAQIPRELLNDPTDRARKQVERMRRNYAFDRARYLLPSAVSTNMMLIMSARAWVQLCQTLLSHPLPEAGRGGAAIREELRLAAPRMLRHATVQPSVANGLRQEFAALQALSCRLGRDYLEQGAPDFSHPPTPSLQLMAPKDLEQGTLIEDLRFHENRYDWVGPNLRRVSVRFAWEAVAFAEIRDLNRHRTGNKHCLLTPRGFYSALDQVPQGLPETDSLHESLRALSEVGRRASAATLDRLQEGDPAYSYWSALGTQYPFEHLTTADKFIYEGELRTGLGAHFRYAQHLHDVLALWYEQFPETRQHINEGTAEPE